MDGMKIPDSGIIGPLPGENGDLCKVGLLKLDNPGILNGVGSDLEEEPCIATT
jgi:hypothetical protein